MDTPSRRSVVFSGGWWVVVREVWCELRKAAAVVCFAIPFLAPEGQRVQGGQWEGWGGGREGIGVTRLLPALSEL